MAHNSSTSPSTPLQLHDLVELIQTTSHSGSSAATFTLPSADSILTTLNTRYKAEQPYINCGYSTLISINPLRVLENVNDQHARRYLAGIAGDEDEEGEEEEEEDPDSPLKSAQERESSAKKREKLQPHPYEFAARVHLALQRTGKSQAIVLR